MMQSARVRSYLARLRRARTAGFLMALLTLYVMLALVTPSARLLDMDTQITQSLQRFRHPWLDSLVEAITFCGDTITFCVIGATVAIYLTRTARRRAAWFCLLSLAGLPLNWLLKQMVGRVRPEQSLVQVMFHEIGLSFPSGHAMESVIFYGFLAFVAWTQTPLLRCHRWTGVGLSVLALLIGISRIYLGVHWFSDVLGGWLAGLICLFLLVEAYRVTGNNDTER